MKISTTQQSSLATAVLILLANIAAARPHPHDRIYRRGCRSTDGEQIASAITCGQPEDVRGCLEHVGLDAAVLEVCLLEAGCGPEESEAEASWAAERCRGEGGGTSEVVVEEEEGSSEEEYVVELRELHRRDDSTTTTTTTTSSSSTATSTSTSSTDTSTSTATSTTTSSSSSSSSGSSTSATSTSTSTASTSASASTSSTTASSTSSSTASTTSSSASSTSTSSSSSSSDGIPTIGYFVAALLALFAGGCASYICFSCCTERSRRKAAIRRAEAKEALAEMHS